MPDETPMPYDLRTAIPVEPGDDDWQEGHFFADFETPEGQQLVEVSAEQYRIIQEYQAADDRAAKGEWEVEKRTRPPPQPAPEEVPASGQLMPRQEAFCRHYATQPVATRAAALAGYDASNAANQGYRLLKNPLVLERIARLRAEQNIRYVVEPDTIHDKLEAVYFEALAERNHAAAVAALRLQAGLARLPTRLAPARPDEREPDPDTRAARAGKSRERARKKPRKADQKAEKSR